MSAESHPKSTTILAREDSVTERKRREFVQAEERKRFGSVEEREHKEPLSQGELGQEMEQHPLLSMLQFLDGIDDRVIADLMNNPEAQRDLENVLRLQHQKKLEKQNALQHNSVPKPGMW